MRSEPRPDLSVREAPSQSTSRSVIELLPEESLQRLCRLVELALGAPVTLLRSAEPDGGAGNSPIGEPLSVLLLATDEGGGAELVVGDVTGDEHADELPVAVPLGARAFAMVPLRVTGDFPAGALCVLDRAPRVWADAELLALRDVAAAIATELDLRRDVERRREREEELRRHALLDALTGLPNRSLFLDRLEHAVERGRRHSDFQFAVLALDLDRFKIVNDSLGHRVGDELLVAVARRLESCVRSEDTVARLGGDEFAILLESIAHPSDGGRVADRIQRSLGAPVDLNGYDVFTSASIGVVLSSSGLESSAAMLQSADIAMSRAKGSGRARYEMYDRAMQALALNRLRMETDLWHAVERREFVVYYQPMITLATGQITELEALVRWKHPVHGLVAPLEFIPTAEEIGLIVPIGSFVLTEACEQLRRWQARFRRETPIAVSVNLSVKQLTERHFVDDVAEIVGRSGLAPDSVKLEITESMLIDNPELARSTLDELHRLGVRVYLDDFGIGYSSLRYLHRLPLDGIKIDRSFVSEMEGEDKHFELVRTVRTLARNVGVCAVAEGVQTAGQLEVLRRLECEYAQGYLFSKPVPAEEIERLLARDPRW